MSDSTSWRAICSSRSDGFAASGRSSDERGMTSSARFMVERASPPSIGRTQQSDSRVLSTKLAMATLPVARMASTRSRYARAAVFSGTR